MTEGTTCWLRSCWSSQSGTSHLRSPGVFTEWPLVGLGQWSSNLAARVWHLCWHRASRMTQPSLSAAVLKVSVLWALLWSSNCVDLLWLRVCLKGPGPTDPRLCGHRDGGQFSGPCLGGCPLPPLFSSLVCGSGICGVYGPSNEREDDQPVALKMTRCKKQWHKPPQMTYTCHLFGTPFLPSDQAHASTTSVDNNLSRLPWPCLRTTWP